MTSSWGRCWTRNGSVVIIWFRTSETSMFSGGGSAQATFLKWISRVTNLFATALDRVICSSAKGAKSAVLQSGKRSWLDAVIKRHCTASGPTMAHETSQSISSTSFALLQTRGCSLSREASPPSRTSRPKPFDAIASHFHRPRSNRQSWPSWTEKLPRLTCSWLSRRG